MRRPKKIERWLSYDDTRQLYEFWDEKPRWDRGGWFQVRDNKLWPSHHCSGGDEIEPILGHALKHKEICKITIERL